ncbi:MAG: GntR family transcriptional regulator [Verrucomicrobia bacterium]|nr:GntR family transcriptional regulator [Verrucomicrobiota bacterium]
MKFKLAISPGASAPIYKQIIDQVRLAASTGKLDSGDQLPSVRILAEELVVNPNTVARAYADLVREGVLESRHGKGAFVARRRKVFTKQERLRRLEPALQAFVNEALALGFLGPEIREAIESKLGSLAQEAPNRTEEVGDEE